MRTFTRDQLGRVTSDQGTTSRGRLYREQRTYFGAGDTATLSSERLGLPTHRFQFGYDPQHQVTSASGDQGYGANFTYSPNGRVWTAKVDAPSSAPLAYPRDVIYDYTGDSDPEAVDALIEPSGDAYVAYLYTDSGAVASRQTRAGTWQFDYDGHDRQRRVVHPDLTSELYYYGLDGARWLALELGRTGAPVGLRWWLGDTELRYDGTGSLDTTWVNVAAGRRIARIEDRATVEYPIHDELGHLIAVADATGSPDTAYIYGHPFQDRNVAKLE
jgi:YD repeat-containing protein